MTTDVIKLPIGQGLICNCHFLQKTIKWTPAWSYLLKSLSVRPTMALRSLNIYENVIIKNKQYYICLMRINSRCECWPRVEQNGSALSGQKIECLLKGHLIMSFSKQSLVLEGRLLESNRELMVMGTSWHICTYTQHALDTSSFLYKKKRDLHTFGPKDGLTSRDRKA